jgi:hypothetical protein
MRFHDECNIRGLISYMQFQYLLLGKVKYIVDCLFQQIGSYKPSKMNFLEG